MDGRRAKASCRRMNQQHEGTADRFSKTLLEQVSFTNSLNPERMNLFQLFIMKGLHTPFCSSLPSSSSDLGRVSIRKSKLKKA